MKMIVYDYSIDMKSEGRHTRIDTNRSQERKLFV